MVEEVMTNPLKATRFGTPFIKKPARITGWYKYKPGDTFTDAAMESVPGKTDEADIYAVLYRNKDKDGNDVYLYGDDVLTSKLPHGNGKGRQQNRRPFYRARQPGSDGMDVYCASGSNVHD